MLSIQPHWRPCCCLPGCFVSGREDLWKGKGEGWGGLVGDNLKVEPLGGEIADFMGEKLGKSTRYPSVVLTALDDIDARRHVQTIWPDLVIDGAIGPLS